MRRVVVVDSRPVTVAADDTVALADRWQSLVDGRAVDQVNGAPVDVACTSPTPHVLPATGAGGVFGLTGRSSDVAAGRPWSISLRAVGYNPATLSGVFAGARLVLPDVQLRRNATVVGGRVTLSPAGTSLSGVAIELVRLRRRTTDATMSPPNLVAIDPPIAGRWVVPTSIDVLTCSDRAPTPGSQPLRLAGPTEPGATEVILSTAAGISMGDVIRVGSEFVTVAGLDPTAPRVRLATPLGLRHRGSDDVTVQNIAIDSTTPLLDTAEIGDVVLAVDPALVPDGKVVRLRSAGLADELRSARRFRSTSGADGQWTWPPIGGVAELELSVTAAGHTLFPPVAANPTLRIASGAVSHRRDFAMT